MTVKKSRRRGVILSLAGQRKFEAARRQLESTLNEGDRFTLEELSERTRLALSTVTRVLDAEAGVDKQTLDQLFAAFGLLLERTDYQHPGADPSPTPALAAPLPVVTTPELRAPVVDWGEAIDVSTFYGRSTELDTLEQWIQVDRCRLIAVLGMGGIGKTALSVKLAQEVTQDFEFILWRTLRNAPPLELLLTDLIQVLSCQQESLLSLPVPTLLNRLLHYLRQHRCLLILDNGETILQSGQFAGAYRPGYEAYGELLRQVGEISHQSCVVLTSREKPETISSLEGELLSVRSFGLPGLLPIDTEQLFNAIGLSPSSIGRGRLMQIYSGNPLALKIVATSIRELFSGDVDAFLAEETMIFNGIRRLLDQQHQRLTELEKQVMIWLAIDREWVTIAELQADIVPSVPKQRLMETLESLARRNLIEQKKARFTQQPVVMEYMTDRIIEQVCAEIEDMPSPADQASSERLIFNAIALSKTTVKEYVRDSQARLILQPIARRLCERFNSTAALMQQMQQLLALIRRGETRGASYGAGNLINLMHHLQLDLTGYDFSNLTVRQACLQDLPLHQVNLAQAHLVACRFAEPLPYPSSLRVSPDGEQIAIGGEDGMVYLWQVSTGNLLLSIQAHSCFVFALTFSPDGQTLVSGSMDCGIKFWDTTTGTCLQSWNCDRPWSLAFSPDGQLLAGSSGDHDRSIHLWDWRTGQCFKTLTGHTGPASEVAFAPDPWVGSTGTTRDRSDSIFRPRLVSSGQDCLVKIWDPESGQCLHTLTEHTGMLWSLSFNPQGDCFATGSFDHSIKIWDLQTGTCLQTLLGHTGEVNSVCFSPDGQLLASASSDRTVRLWDMATGQCLNVLQGHLDGVWSVAFAAGYTPNGEWKAGQTLVSFGFEQAIRFWDVSRLPPELATASAEGVAASDPPNSISGHCIKTLQGNSTGIRSLAAHPQHPWVASGGWEGLPRLWDVQSGQCLQTLTGHSTTLWRVAFHPQGDLLASGGIDGEVRIWELETGRCRHSLRKSNAWIQALGFSSQGPLVVASSGDATIRFWDVQTGECWRSIVLQPDAYLLGMDFHPQGHYFITAGNDGQICWWDMESGECFRRGGDKEGHTWAIAFHPQGHLFASLGNDSVVKVWDAESGEVLHQLHGHTGVHGSAAFSPDGTILATGRSDRTIRLWDVATQQCLKVLHGHTATVTSVAFLTPNSSASGAEQQFILATGSLDGTIRLWDIQTGECLKIMRPDRLYEGMDITGVTGLTAGTIATLKSLGAVEAAVLSG